MELKNYGTMQCGVQVPECPARQRRRPGGPGPWHGGGGRGRAGGGDSTAPGQVGHLHMGHTVGHRIANCGAVPGGFLACFTLQHKMEYME